MKKPFDDVDFQSQYALTDERFIAEKILTIKEKSPEELTAFDLTFLFATRCKLCKIHGILHTFNGKHHCPVDRQELESKILEVLFDELDKKGSIRIIGSIVYIIEHMSLPQYEETLNWVGFANGVLNIKNWSFLQYSEFNNFKQKGASRNVLPDFPVITYNLCASYSNFAYQYDLPYADKFFYEITGGDLTLITRIYEMIGYLLVPDTSAKAFFLFQGVPDSGKSILGRFIEGFFPTQCITALDISRLGGQFLPEALSTSRLNLSMDLPDGLLSKKAIATIKMLTGNDLITHEPKYKDARPFRGQCKFLFSINGKLKMTGRDTAFLDRIVCIPFRHSIPKNKRDESLLEKLNNEREGIMMRALKYYQDFVSRNRVFSGESNYLPDIEYRLTPNDTITEFVSEACILHEEAYTSTDALYTAYLSFCVRNKLKAVSSKSGFSQRISALYATHLRPHRKHTDKTDNLRGYYGIKMDNQFEPLRQKTFDEYEELNSDDDFDECE